VIRLARRLLPVSVGKTPPAVKTTPDTVKGN